MEMLKVASRMCMNLLSQMPYDLLCLYSIFYSINLYLFRINNIDKNGKTNFDWHLGQWMSVISGGLDIHTTVFTCLLLQYIGAWTDNSCVYVSFYFSSRLVLFWPKTAIDEHAQNHIRMSMTRNIPAFAYAHICIYIYAISE